MQREWPGPGKLQTRTALLAPAGLLCRSRCAATAMPLSSTNLKQRLIPIVLAQAVGLACGLIGLKLSSHLVPPAVLGLYGLFLTFTPIGMWLVYVGLLKYVLRHWAATTARTELRHEILAVWVRRLPWLALLAGLPALALTQLTPAQRGLLWLALFSSAGGLTLAAFAQMALQADRAHWRDCAAVTVGSITRSFLPPLLYAATGGLAAMWFGFTLHALTMALTGIWAVRASYGSSSASPAVVPASWRIYEGPLFTLLAAANLILLGINRWLVVWFAGEQEAGYFTLAGNAVAIITSMLATMLMQYVQPDLFALGDRGAESRPALARRVDRVALFYMLTGLAGVAALSALAPWLVGPLISPDYRPALAWIFPAGCFGLTVGLGLFYHTLLLAGRRERACAPVDLAAAAILIIGSIVAAAAGTGWLARWLVATPLVPWLLSRTLARHHLFKPDSDPVPAPVR